MGDKSIGGTLAVAVVAGLTLFDILLLKVLSWNCHCVHRALCRKMGQSVHWDVPHHKCVAHVLRMYWKLTIFLRYHVRFDEYDIFSLTKR